MNSLKTSLFLIAVTFTVAGCGGGGGGGGSSTPAPIVIAGTIVDSNGIDISGGTIKFPADSLTTTSNSSGTFALEIPAADSGSSIVLDFYNASSQLILVQSYSITASSGQTQNIGTITLGPPPPPATPELAVK